MLTTKGTKVHEGCEIRDFPHGELMNVMNVMNMWKSATFMPQAYENKGFLNVMNVVQRYFAARARELPIPTGDPECCLNETSK